MALALALGAAGGFVAFKLRLPLAWMIGAIIATTLAALAGLELRMSQGLRSFMVVVLGVMLGSAFTPSILGRAAEWLPSIASLLLYVSLLTALVSFYLRKVANYDPVTAYFAATPGGLNEMTIVGGAMGGDERLISLVHGVRILLIAMTIPIWFRFFGGYQPGGLPGPSGAAIPWRDLVILVLCGAVGLGAARLLRLPAASLTGPMILSAAAHLSGFTASRPPLELIALAQVVVGTAVGCRFAGFPLRQVLRTIANSIGQTAMMLALTIAAALLLSPIVGASVTALVLAFAPGGLAEMSLIALSLGIDAAFVTSHHVARIVMVVLLAPLFFRALRGRLASKRVARS
ncbi:MAG TPA: AbrB family transcriptional regulator [Alphaproteobacteria bacterium]|nr:AbrB family transcriptional regulator [Alphaproteobacteria bacterium]